MPVLLFLVYAKLDLCFFATFSQVRQDIRTFKFELINILKMNDMKTPKDAGGAGAMGKKARDLERKIQKGFNVTKVDEGQMNKFAAMMKGRGGKGGGGDQIGSQANKHVIRRRALRKQLLAKGTFVIDVVTDMKPKDSFISLDRNEYFEDRQVSPLFQEVIVASPLAQFQKNRCQLRDLESGYNLSIDTP